MSYTIIVSKSVQKQLDALPPDMCDRAAEKIQQLADQPRPSGVVKLKGFDHEYRIRVGDYRVLKLMMKIKLFGSCSVSTVETFIEINVIIDH